MANKAELDALMSAEDYQRAQEDLSGQFSGIGAEMGVKNLDDPEDEL